MLEVNASVVISCGEWQMKISGFVLGCVLPVVALGVSSVAQADGDKQDYKCHIDSAQGDKVVFYRWKTDELALKIAGLPGSQLADSRGKKYYIKSVAECVPLNVDFGSDEAQKLDKQTLK
jgi:hypothetical protein